MANKNKEKSSQNQAASAEKTEKPTVMQELVSWVVTLGAAVIIALFLTNFIILNARVPSGSMENTIMTGDRLFGSRLTYLFGAPRRGDIIVFKYPVSELALRELKGSEYKDFLKANKIRHTNYIKRLIGLPGETVDIVDGKIYINGSKEPLDEPYLKEEWTRDNTGFHFEVPEDCYLMLGDNRNNSADCRYWKVYAQSLFQAAGSELAEADAEAVQYVTKKQILGKAYLRYWPVTKISLLK